MNKHLAIRKIEDSKQVYHDLDNQAGAWDDKEFLEFKHSTADFGMIDEALWK